MTAVVHAYLRSLNLNVKLDHLKRIIDRMFVMRYFPNASLRMLS